MDVNISNIRLELPDLDFPKVTKQAVSKARQGILPSLFKDLFSVSTDIFYNNIKKRKMWRGKYNIFAVDGSRISIPSSKSNYEKYGEMFSKRIRIVGGPWLYAPRSMMSVMISLSKVC